jgi:SAM-dependent methyltransferase
MANLVLCRNCLDHMLDPEACLREMARILRPDGFLFLSVDLGGVPTPDEPQAFSKEGLDTLIAQDFLVVKEEVLPRAHAKWRDGRVRMVARRKSPASVCLDRGAILEKYESLLTEELE